MVVSHRRVSFIKQIAKVLVRVSDILVPQVASMTRVPATTRMPTEVFASQQGSAAILEISFAALAWSAPAMEMCPHAKKAPPAPASVYLLAMKSAVAAPFVVATVLATHVVIKQ
jgi:hypothetical protein